jgi:hypothetical protein
MLDLRAYDIARVGRVVMFRRSVMIVSLVAMGLAPSGCTKCGPIWDDWIRSPNSCKSDQF